MRTSLVRELLSGSWNDVLVCGSIDVQTTIRTLLSEIFLSSREYHTELAFRDITLQQKHNAVAALGVMLVRCPISPWSHYYSLS